MTIFLLFAETLAGRVIEVDSSTCDSVRCVKDKIQEKTGKSWEYQTLTSAGYELENERLVREFNTNKRPSLHLTLRVSGPLEMLVRRIGGNTFGIVVNPSDSITSVKEMIFEKEGIPVEEQEFMFAGQATNDYAALRAHMDRESMRHVVLHFRAVGRIHVGKISEFGCPLNITVQPSWTMKDLSEEVQATYGVPIEQQHWSLLSEGVDTDGEQTLAALTGGKHTIVPAAVRFTGKVRIAMSDMPNEMASVEFDYTDTLADVATRVEAQAGFPLEQVKLFYGKDVLTGDGTIGDHIPGGVLSMTAILHFAGLVQVFTRNKDGEVFPFAVDPEGTVDDLKRLIHDRAEYPARAQELSIDGVELEDEQPLSKWLDADCSFPYFIDIGNILKLVLQLGSFGAHTYFTSGAMAVAQLKSVLELDSESQRDQQILYYNGVEMEDERTLGSYNTDDKFVMNLSRSLRGGKRIYVQAQGKRSPLDVLPSDTIGDLKAMIRKRGFPLDKSKTHVLLEGYGSIDIEDDSKPLEHDLRAGMVIRC